MNQQQPNQQQIQIKITDEILAGKYANAMQVSHTKEEFILDFMNIVAPAGVVCSRIITSPSHLKRIVSALHENLKNYEATHGAVQESQEPTGVGFQER